MHHPEAGARVPKSESNLRTQRVGAETFDSHCRNRDELCAHSPQSFGALYTDVTDVSNVGLIHIIDVYTTTGWFRTCTAVVPVQG